MEAAASGSAHTRIDNTSFIYHHLFDLGTNARVNFVQTGGRRLDLGDIDRFLAVHYVGPPVVSLVFIELDSQNALSLLRLQCPNRVIHFDTLEQFSLDIEMKRHEYVQNGA